MDINPADGNYVSRIEGCLENLKNNIWHALWVKVAQCSSKNSRYLRLTPRRRGGISALKPSTQSGQSFTCRKAWFTWICAARWISKRVVNGFVFGNTLRWRRVLALKTLSNQGEYTLQWWGGSDLLLRKHLFRSKHLAEADDSFADSLQ